MTRKIKLKRLEVNSFITTIINQASINGGSTNQAPANGSANQMPGNNQTVSEPETITCTAYLTEESNCSTQTNTTGAVNLTRAPGRIISQ